MSSKSVMFSLEGTYESGGHFPECPLGSAGPTVSLITQVMGTGMVVRVKQELG